METIKIVLIISVSITWLGTISAWFLSTFEEFFNVEKLGNIAGSSSIISLVTTTIITTIYIIMELIKYY